MRRAAACGLSAGRVMFMMLWFFYSFRYENVHPLESGYFRLKFRRDRRSGLPRESMLAFYPSLRMGDRAVAFLDGLLDRPHGSSAAQRSSAIRSARSISTSRLQSGVWMNSMSSRCSKTRAAVKQRLQSSGLRMRRAMPQRYRRHMKPTGLSGFFVRWKLSVRGN